MFGAGVQILIFLNLKKMYSEIEQKYNITIGWDRNTNFELGPVIKYGFM